MWCVIPAAGRASRLRSSTAGRSKALLEIGASPLVAHLLDRIDGSFTDVCLVTGPDDLEIFRAMLGHRWRDLELHYVVQAEPAGVADAVCQAAECVSGPFVVLLGDCYFDGDISDLPLRWKQTGSDGAVLVEPVVAPGGEPMGLVTLVDDRIVRIFKAPWAGDTEWRVCGAYLFPESFFDVAAETPPAASGEYELEDVVSRFLDAGATFAAIPFSGWRRNINTPEDLAAVELRIAADPLSGLDV